MKKRLNTAVVFLLRGIAKAGLKDYARAIADFTKAIRIKPDYAEAYFGRGLAKYDLNDYNGAIAELDKFRY
ncbi:MAG: tetratricopeptide repeat protein [Ignavibacteria bacterium]